MNNSTTIAHKPALVVGIALILIALLTAYDASTMNIRSGYGVGPQATSYLIAAILGLLGLCHLPVALRRFDGEVPTADWVAVGWVGLALFCLIASIAVGGGFIIGSALLFAFTARAFGRKAFIADFIIGIFIAFLIFLLFNKLLSLSLPVGPLERLF